MQDDGAGGARLDQDALGKAQVKTGGGIVGRDGGGGEGGERLRLGLLRLSGVRGLVSWWRGVRRGVGRGDQRREGAVGEVNCDVAPWCWRVGHGN